jgi:hypothetical protein
VTPELSPFADHSMTTTLIDDDHPPRAEEARALLADCADRFATLLAIAARGCIENADDLFESVDEVREADVLHFRQHRGEWQERFERVLRELVQRRLGGTRRKGRRPDTDVSAATLRVLSAYDQERQAAIVRASAALAFAARRETGALDRRVGLLLAERSSTETDNPFGIAYLLDAIGATSRAVYPNPRVWRPLMERLLDDLKPAVVKTFITLNRHLADRGVLPEIKAALRARSDLRPADDNELLPLFERMLQQAGSQGGVAALDVVVPSVDELSGDRHALVFADKATPERAPGASSPGSSPAAPTASSPAAPPTALAPTASAPSPSASAAAAAPEPGPADGESAVPQVPANVARALYAAYARYLQRAAAAPAAPTPPDDADEFAFPQLDSMMALGHASAMIAELDQWQRFDPEMELAAGDDAADGVAAAPTALPLNRIPLIRNAIAAKIANPADRMTMDVVGLIFDYIFRDPSIPDAQRRIFARLQVPIAKAALLDRSFFSNRNHPARRLLDDLAAAAVGAQGDDDYRQAFEALARDVVDRICADFGIDVSTFETADARIRPFVEHEQAVAAGALREDIGTALATEESDADRAQVRALLRDKLAGLEIPFDVRSFTETVWADHLTEIRSTEGIDSEAWRTAIATLDDLLWSIAAKERTAQKARLTRLIPSLVRRLRAGIGALGAAGERVGDFFESLYRLHIDVLRPPTPAPAPAAGKVPPAAAAAAAHPAAIAPPPTAADTAPATAATATAFDPATVHDFVTELALGTWLLFNDGGKATPARLFWVSPLRTRYIFTTRGRSRAISLTPEELAWQLSRGHATLIVEPVPLFDRAVSAALDTLAAQAPTRAAAS